MENRFSDCLGVNQSTKDIDDSKAATSGDHKNPGSIAENTYVGLSLVSRLGDTDRSYFDFHSIFLNFADLWYSGLDEHFETNKYWKKIVLKNAVSQKNN